jgi:hypothetical protein
MFSNAQAAVHKTRCRLAVHQLSVNVFNDVQNIEVLQQAGAMQLLRPLLLDNVPRSASTDSVNWHSPVAGARFTQLAYCSQGLHRMHKALAEGLTERSARMPPCRATAAGTDSCTCATVSSSRRRSRSADSQTTATTSPRQSSPTRSCRSSCAPATPTPTCLPFALLAHPWHTLSRGAEPER